MDSFRCNAAAAVEIVFEPVFGVAFELVFALVFEPVFDVAFELVFALVFELVLQLYQYDVTHHLMNGHLHVQRCGCSGVLKIQMSPLSDPICKLIVITNVL